MHNCSGLFKTHFLAGCLKSITVCIICLHPESLCHHFVSVQGLHWNGDALIIKLAQFHGRYVQFLTRVYFYFFKLTITFSLMYNAFASYSEY